MIINHNQDPLIKKSIEVILENQAPSGAYVASPNFPSYHYCWFRDSSFVAYAMNLYEQHASAARFHAWSAGVINAREETIQRAIKKAFDHQPLTDNDVLHTRYTLDGEEGKVQVWENFQLDGLGTWLWSLQQSVNLSGEPLSADLQKAAGLAADYLAALWQQPCYDCWEERRNDIHPHTLAAIYSGLQSASILTEIDYGPVTEKIKKYLEEHAVMDGHWAKYIGSRLVDASLLGLAVPYRVFPLDDPRTLKTVAIIESELRQDGGGVHRYATDEYYGGGEWVLLTSWLAWYYAECGQIQKAADLQRWVEQQSTPSGWLAEQVSFHLNLPDRYEPWLAKWGPVASPLLWSHANYLIVQKYFK